MEACWKSATLISINEIDDYSGRFIVVLFCSRELSTFVRPGDLWWHRLARALIESRFIAVILIVEFCVG